MIVVDLVAHGQTVRGKLMPSLLSGLGVPSPWVVGAVTRGAVAVSSHQRGTQVRAVPVDGGHCLGWPRRGSAALGGQALGSLLKGDAKEMPCLMQPLVGLRV
jgi:hypothetical protein